MKVLPHHLIGSLTNHNHDRNKKSQICIFNYDKHLLCTCLFKFCIPLWLLHGRREHVITKFHFVFLSPHTADINFIPLEQFAGQLSLNILEIFAETQSSTFWLHSRRRWFCLCLIFLFTFPFYHIKPHQTSDSSNSCPEDWWKGFEKAWKTNSLKF